MRQAHKYCFLKADILLIRESSMYNNLEILLQFTDIKKQVNAQAREVS